MQRRYSEVYSDLLRALKGREEEFYEKLASYGGGTTEKYAKRYFKMLLGEQPLKGKMWGGLFEDVIQAIDTYLDTPGANFPAPAGTSATPAEELLGELLGPVTREEEEELKAELKRKGETYERPINFASFRGNPIIRSGDGEKMWVAPHFQEREDGKTGALPPNGHSVRDVWSYSTGSYHWKRQSNKETLPIELSRWHMHRFFREGTPKSSKLHVIEDEIYVYYSFEFEEPSGGYEKGNPVVGVDRGEAIIAAYAAVGPEGQVLKDGSSASKDLQSRLKEIDREIAATQERGENPGELWNDRRNLVQDALHRISNQIIDTASRHGAAIVFEDLENLSGPNNSRMKRRQYNRLIEYVRYKEKEKGLSYGGDDFDLDVHPAGTSQTCPECGHREEQNRGGRDHPNLSRDEFRCQNCGYGAHADKNAARMIGIRGLWIINGGKDGTGCKTLTQYTKSLSQTRTSQTEAQRLS